MRVNSYNKFFTEVAKIMNTDVKSVKPIEGRYDAIVNPEWHHVSIATLANIDNDMVEIQTSNYR